MSTTKWQFYNTRTAQWVDFPKRVMVILEKNFSNLFGGSKSCIVEHGDADYKINFDEMKAIDVRNFHRWLDIRRAVFEGGSPAKVPAAVMGSLTRDAPISPVKQGVPAVAAGPSSIPIDAPPTCKLFGSGVSPPAAACLLLLKEGNVGHTYIEVDLSKGEHLTPEFLALNPRHQVPVLVDDDGTIVWESNAVLRYICNTFSLDDSFYPTDTKLRSRCDMALDWRQTSLAPPLAKVTYPTLGFTQDWDAIPAAKQALATELNLFETFWLKNSPFICGNVPSIADFAVVMPLLALEVTDMEVPGVVKAYIRRFAAACPHWDVATAPMKKFYASVTEGREEASFH